MQTFLLWALLASAAAPVDKPGCTDHPLFPTRMPGYTIANCKVEEFGRYEFFTPKPPRMAVEGKYTFLTYRVTDPAQQPSAVAVVRNYEAALRRVGATAVQTDTKGSWWVNGKVTKDGREVWADAEKGNGLIWLRVVEVQPMQQHVVADAAALGSDLRSSGHVAVYGINFDTNRAEVKPDSKPALEQVAALLRQDAALKLMVVGHTDTVGSLDANLALSRARAEAVVKVLVSEHGIAAARLHGYGVGPLAPVATNSTDEGRARNRRVELVKE